MRNEWEEKSKNLLKAELARLGWGYDDLRLALEDVGVCKSTRNITKVIGEGKFPFYFFLQCAEALKLKSIKLS